jgi:hypothetical protein
MGMRGNGIVGLLVVRGEVTKMTASSEGGVRKVRRGVDLRDVRQSYRADTTRAGRITAWMVGISFWCCVTARP